MNPPIDYIPIPQDLVETKYWYQSRVMLLNLSAAILVAIEALTGALQPVLPLPLYETIAALLPIANTVLRMLTTMPITALNEP